MALRTPTGELRDDITSDEVERILFSSAPAGNGEQALVRDNPLLAGCRDQTLPEEKCAPPTEDSEDGGDGGDTTDGGSGNGASDGDANEIAQRLLDAMRTPEAAMRSVGSPRAGVGDVQGNVDAFELKAGPADVEAVYDFRSLQVAFEHVWAQAFDEDVVATALDLYREIVDLGGSVEEPGDGQRFLDDLVAEARTVLSTDILGNSTTTPTEEAPERAPRVRDHRTNERVSADVGAGGEVPKRPRQRLRELLDELTERLNEPYAFTVFAAEGEERSVNFGVMVTYRQRWTPQTYQPGEFVDSITLAPNETQSYRVREVIKERRTRSTTELANQLRRTEDRETRRDVSDIVETPSGRCGSDAWAKGASGA